MGALPGRTLNLSKTAKSCRNGISGTGRTFLVTIKLHPLGKNTSMEVRQTNIPDESFENIKEGWMKDYGGLEQLFEE